MSRAAPEIASPPTLEGALELLASPGWQLLAGGTALVPGFHKRTPKRLLSLHELRRELRFVAVDRTGLRAGALATLRDLAGSEGIRDRFPLLATAARAQATPVHQHRATVGGTVAMATGPVAAALAVLEAMVELRSRHATRRIHAVSFEAASRHSGELVTNLHAAAPPPRARQSFGRATLPSGPVFLAAIVLISRGICTAARFAIASKTQRAIRLLKAEAAVTGKHLDEASVAGGLAAAAEDVHPLADWRPGRGTWALGRLLADALTE